MDHPGGGRKRPEEISECFKIYPRQCDKCGGEIKIYENKYDEHVVEDIVIKKKATCYSLHYGYWSRGSKVVDDVFGKRYEGVLGCDFYSAYNKLEALAKQRCVGHLLDEIKKIQEKNRFSGGCVEWVFCERNDN